MSAPDRLRDAQGVEHLRSAIVSNQLACDGKFKIYDNRDENSDERFKQFAMDLEKFCNPNSFLHANVVERTTFHKMIGLSYIKTGDEVRGINHLIESHSAQHRQQANLRFIKSETRVDCGDTSMQYGVNPMFLSFDIDKTNNSDSLRAKLREMPKEWYMIQVTAAYELHKSPETPASMHVVHLIIFPTGPDAAPPFCITLPKPEGTIYDVAREIKQLLERNRGDLQADYKFHDEYWDMRARQNKSMLTAVTELENTWLREWRILFIADPIGPSNLVKDLTSMIDKLLVDERPTIQVSPRTRWLLRKIATCSCYLNKTEIARAVHCVLPERSKLAKNVVLSIFGRINVSNSLKKERRKNLVMIVDEQLDYLPLESMKILQKQPVTRFPCLHMAYAMFKEHEDTIVDGCKIVKLDEIPGMFIVNPSKNLPKMEKRLRIFIEYWLPNWKGIYNEKPDEEEFVKALVNLNLLMYNGHGSGIQYLSGEQIEKLRVKSVAMLFGCSSLKLFVQGGRFAPYGISNQYLTACSPCILGMLWEVTDMATDKMTAKFLGRWIPSSAEIPWANVDYDKWGKGTLEFVTKSKSLSEPYEPEMLRAVALSKDHSQQYMNSAAVIVRGLPIKLQYKN